jgi:MFS family permease
LLAQWGIIPILSLDPRRMMLVGLVIAAVGTVLTGFATSLYGIALSFALASLGFGFTRPGFTAGASLAVGPEGQGSVAGKVTSVNGAAFVLGPSIGVGLYEISKPLPYFIAALALVVLLFIAWYRLHNSPDLAADD